MRPRPRKAAPIAIAIAVAAAVAIAGPAAAAQRKWRPREGLIASGAPLFSAMYVHSAVLGIISERQLLWPVAGPFLRARDLPDSQIAWKLWLVADGLTQITGLALLTAGLLAGPGPAAPPDPAPLSPRSRYGLIIAGAATLGLSYLISCMLGTLGSSQFRLFIPFAGPLWQASLPADWPLRFFLVSDALTQVTSAALLIAGAVGRKVPLHPRSLQLAPFAVRGGGGLLVSVHR